MHAARLSAHEVMTLGLMAKDAVRPNRERHVPTLDGIRGIAILLVLATHSARPVETSSGSAWRWIMSAAQSGWLGVDVFFALSGFLISGILLDSAGQPHYFRNFFARRALRIFPLYYATLAFYFVVVPIFWRTPSAAFRALEEWRPWYWAYVQNWIPFITHSRGEPAPAWLLAPTWSLAVEEQFYLLWPFVVRLIGPRGLLVLACGLVLSTPLARSVMLSSGVDGEILYGWTFSRLDALAAGAAVAAAVRVFPGKDRVLSRVGGIIASAGAAALLGLFVVSHGLDKTEQTVIVVGFWLPAVTTAGVILMIATGGLPGTVGRFLQAEGLRAFGKYSYAIYVFHLPVFLVVRSAFQRIGAISGWPVPLSFLAEVGVSWSAVFAAAWLSWRYFEAPILKLKGRFAADGAANG